MRCIAPRRLGPLQVARLLAVPSRLRVRAASGRPPNHEGLIPHEVADPRGGLHRRHLRPAGHRRGRRRHRCQGEDLRNCTALNKVYPHGVGLKNAHDHTSGTPVTNFARKPLVYKANKKSDRARMDRLREGVTCGAVLAQPAAVLEAQPSANCTSATPKSVGCEGKTSSSESRNCAEGRRAGHLCVAGPSAPQWPFMTACEIRLSSLRISTPLLSFTLMCPARVQSSSSALKSSMRPAFSEDHMLMAEYGSEYSRPSCRSIPAHPE